MNTDEKEFDIVSAVKSMQEYWNTYDDQMYWRSYSEETFLHDALYGIGIAINKKKYYQATGFRRFIAAKLYAYANKITKDEFISQIKHGRTDNDRS